jgi:hypothetical protein
MQNDRNMRPGPRLGKVSTKAFDELAHRRSPTSTSATQTSLCRSPTVK